MAIRIDKKIVGYKVVKKDDQAPAAPTVTTTPGTPELEQMHENLERPELLFGSTYKIKTPTSEHALYVTINDVILNPDTEHASRQPFEIFINSKNMDHFQWVVALTRVISAVFRKGGDTTFLVNELKGIFDPRGGYFKRGGKFMPSLVAEIGDAIETHMKMIGMLPAEQLDEHQKALIEQKKQEYLKKHQQQDKNDPGETGEPFPPSASLCGKCHTKAMIIMDGCQTCLNCGDSKCG